MMRLLALALALIWASPALAALPPQYYEQARRDAESVVVIEVAQVEPPASADGYGACVVEGRVIGVLRGDSYVTGAAIRINVPCAHQGARTPIGGVLYKTFETLQSAPYGRAYLDAAGQLALYQYDVMMEWTGPLEPP